MANLAQANQRGETSAEKFIRFRVSEELWEQVNIAKIKARTSLEQLCTDALVRYLKDSRHAK